MLELVRRAETLGISPENVVREAFQKLILYYSLLKPWFLLCASGRCSVKTLL